MSLWQEQMENETNYVAENKLNMKRDVSNLNE